jgi:hypothetical protein
MRTFIFLLSLAILAGSTAYGVERNWTIARDVYSAKGELITVRGDLAYLKIDGRVEEIPIERLSALDQQYIASLTLAPILPGPAPDGPAENRQIVHEEMPLPGQPDAPSASLQLNGPNGGPTYSGEPQPLPGPRPRVDSSGRMITPQPGVAANYLAPIPEPRAASANDRRYVWPPQAVPSNQAAKSPRDDEKKDAGILGFRARRLERQRAAARSR